MKYHCRFFQISFAFVDLSSSLAFPLIYFLTNKGIGQYIEFKSVGPFSMNHSQSTFAVPFITYQEGHGFSLSKQAEEFLTSLPEDRQLGIVSIVGKYRTGKSFFVNRVLLDQKKSGFQVGPTINPCTKGLWLWKKTIPSSSTSKMDIIMIDTQGFGGMDENTNHDSRIFLFSLLLSSYFIYNSVGSIDENALTTLNLIINLAKEIQTKANGRNGEDISSFPAFLWVVRDFTLMLQDKNGNKINSKEYLQNALELQKGSSDTIENKNKIRRHLKHFFQDRDCELMVRPTERQKDLQRLDEMDSSMLRPQFVGQVEAIRSKIFSRVKAKKINDKALNGVLLVSLIKGYMQAINKGHLPNVESAWFYVCRTEGVKAIKEATEYLEKEVEEMLKNPIKVGEMSSLKKSIKDKVLLKFKKRSLGSEDTHPDLLEKLEKRIEESVNDLTKKTRAIWQDKYKQSSEKLMQSIKDKIYSDQYEEFSDFIKDFEKIKEEYDHETADGDSMEKWKYFNEISQNLYRLAGETITTKINKALHLEKIMMEQKLQMKEEEIQEQQKQLYNQKETLSAKILILEKENAKINSLEDSHKNRALQYKTQHDKLYQKYRLLYNQHEEIQIQLDKLKKQNKKHLEHDMQTSRNELISVRSTLEKERSLHEMEKTYMEEEIQRYKERALGLESQCRKLRTSNTKLTSDLEEMENKYQQKEQEVEILSQTNSTFSKKIQSLLAENSMKNQLMTDHSQWLLQKSYLQNQVSFLKKTINENRQLHDSLLVLVQQSMSASQTQSNAQLVQANKGLASALENVEGRCKIFQQKYQKMKEFKKVIKHCVSMQCANCFKSIQIYAFPVHIQQCLGGTLLQEKAQHDCNKENVHISVSQTVVKASEDGKKPYTEYRIEVSKGDLKWKLSKRYKQFSQLQQMLIRKFPSVKYPQTCNFLIDINNLVATKKNILAEDRRKSLQLYLRDLSKIQEIRKSDIFKGFLEFPDYFSQKSGFKYGENSEKKDRLHI